MDTQENRWRHRPPHIFIPDTFYMVTASTLHKARLFYDDNRLLVLQDSLFEVTAAYRWKLEAWALFSNHYHFIAESPDDGTTLKKMLQRLHSQTSRLLNRFDGTSGRSVWFQYWDSCITFETSYYARLKYVHSNAVKHGLVADAGTYAFCSAAWFQAQPDELFRSKVAASSCDKLDIDDEY